MIAKLGVQQTDRQIHKEIKTGIPDRQRQTDHEIDRQTDKQTNRPTDHEITDRSRQTQTYYRIPNIYQYLFGSACERC